MFTTMETAFICTDELWAWGFGESHPLKPERLKRTYELLMAYHAGDAPNSRLVAPVPAGREELLLFHTAAYAHAVARLYGAGGGSEPPDGAGRHLPV
jgi:acetoin utilization deacetylase AcuC-like enzyme